MIVLIVADTVVDSDLQSSYKYCSNTNIIFPCYIPGKIDCKLKVLRYIDKWNKLIGGKIILKEHLGNFCYFGV